MVGKSWRIVEGLAGVGGGEEGGRVGEGEEGGRGGEGSLKLGETTRLN